MPTRNTDNWLKRHFIEHRESVPRAVAADNETETGRSREEKKDHRRDGSNLDAEFLDVRGRRLGRRGGPGASWT